MLNMLTSAKEWCVDAVVRSGAVLIAVFVAIIGMMAGGMIGYIEGWDAYIRHNGGALARVKAETTSIEVERELYREHVKDLKGANAELERKLELAQQAHAESADRCAYLGRMLLQQNAVVADVAWQQSKAAYASALGGVSYVSTTTIPGVDSSGPTLRYTWGSSK